MKPRPGAWITGFAALLAIALVAAPVWDAWAYRRLRSPVGAVPIGVILPLRADPSAPAPLPRDEEPPGRPEAEKRSGAARSSVPAAAVPPPNAAAGDRTVAVAAASPDRGLVAPASAVAPSSAAAPAIPARADSTPPGHAPARAPSGRMAGRSNVPEPRAAEPRTDSAGPAAGAGTGSYGWVAVPVSDDTPQPTPEPDPAPPPSPKSPGPWHGGGPNPTPQAIPTLQLIPPAGVVSVGQSLVVSVRLSGASNVTSLPFHVQFDPSVLEFQSAEQGPAVGGAMQPILLASVSPARPGDLAVGLSLLDSGGLLQGTGTVIRLQFRALAAGSSTLEFSHATIRGRISEPVEARFQNATVNVH